MTGERPWFAGSGASAGKEKLHAPATLRNREVITDVLARELPETGTVLEVASGSGEHVVHFARAFPALTWQPTDPDAAALASIAAWSDEAAVANILSPLALDAASPDWLVDRADAVICINMAHISPWAATLGLFAGAARLLGSGKALILYGPFLQDDVETVPSNLAFDAQLRARDPAFGIRAVEDIDQAAEAHGLRRTALYKMPANNLALVYRLS